jgi:hypothetical protein
VSEPNADSGRWMLGPGTHGTIHRERLEAPMACEDVGCTVCDTYDDDAWQRAQIDRYGEP